MSVDADKLREAAERLAADGVADAETVNAIVRDVPLLIERLERAESERDRLAEALEEIQVRAEEAADACWQSQHAVRRLNRIVKVARDALAGEEQT